MSPAEECRKCFEKVLADRSRKEATAYWGQVEGNKFDPGFGLKSSGQFEYGDFRVELPDRFVVVETEVNVSGTLANLVKYWPYCRPGRQSWPTLTRPILLLHVFARNPTQKGKDLSHQLLWDFTWKEMKADLWRQNPPRLFARRYEYVKDDYNTLRETCDAFRRCLTEDLPSVCRDIFEYNGSLAK
jgi:hypothetical protein